MDISLNLNKEEKEFLYNALMHPNIEHIKKVDNYLKEQLGEDHVARQLTEAMTADKLFKKLGYERDKKHETPTMIIYSDIYEKQIIIDKVSFHFGKRHKDNVPMLITKAEDAAIHQKLKELSENES